MTRRTEATRRTLAKYARPFSWRERVTCLHMARTQMRNMGHRPPSIPDFRSALGARTALKKAGFATMADLFDSLLPRITPAQMWVGDIALLPGDQMFDSICISDTVGKLVGFHEDGEDGVRAQLVLSLDHVIGAWRV
ncbi:hypothetical protein [Sphingobium sp.]|uniref:DUF6950 family protein n=1 Tax=Sphingobium sp. TaxID=1912891 RepID=UPI00257D2376|nr:hypothetical protein [Sphingobium sp.]